MSKIDTLVADLCPDGVEYRTLNEVCKSGRKGSLKREELIADGAYPVVNGGTGYYGRHDSFNNEGNCIVFSSRGAAGYVSYQHDPFYAAALCYPFFSKDENVLNTRFLYFALKTQEKENIEKLVSHGGVPALNKSDVLKIEIPVPPIEVQREIVRILEAFTALTDELTAKLAEEVAARKEQYAYYRDRLLSLESLEALDGKPVEMVRPGDVCQIKNGRDYKHLDSGDVPVYGSGGYMGINVAAAAHVGPTVLLPRKGSISNVFYVEGPIWNVDTVFYTIVDGDLLLVRYFYHVMLHTHIENYSTGSAARPSLTQTALRQIEIPVPSLATQQRVVDILDRFDALTTSLTDGLPAEIEARRTQYEYYRDRLLDFPRRTIGAE